MSDSRVVAVIDDDLAVLESFRFLLEAAGYAVAAFNSAAAFLGDRAILPSCLIVDQHMPQMTGLELVAHLRSQASDTPALLVTAAPTASIVARANQLGVQVLEKPPAESDVLAFVDRHA
jgi:FixJ family two-component response regulator